MSFSFEVKETDLGGRNGTIRANGRKIETPYMFPVVHPVVQSIPTCKISEMGFGGVMTNSYIMYSRRREEAIRDGVHDLVKFDGVVMTDSGGYQVLEYGDIGVGTDEVADFQSRIGSDLAVTFDRPTGDSDSKRYARETMEFSLRSAVRTIGAPRPTGTTWVGPVQGGLFPDLLRKSTRSLCEAGFRYLALGSPTKIMENYRFSDLARMISVTRRAMPYELPLHLFGAGHPLTMPLAVALGCDTFDSASYILFARRENYMTERGVSPIRGMKYLPCSCPICVKTTVTDLLEMDKGERVDLIATHNLWELRKEMETCRQAVSEGRLWDLLQEKGMAHPSLREAMDVVHEEVPRLSRGTKEFKDRGLLLRTEDDLRRPEVLMASRRLDNTMRRRSKSATLLTETVSRPWKNRREMRQPSDDIYRLHEVFGPYPAELDFVYPLTQTETAAGLPRVTRAQAVRKLRSMGYASVTVSSRPQGQSGRPKSRRKSKAASPSAPRPSSRPR